MRIFFGPLLLMYPNFHYIILSRRIPKKLPSLFIVAGAAAEDHQRLDVPAKV